MASVRIWQKKKIVLDQLNFRQRDMVKIGTVGVATVLNRVTAALGPSDGPAKPLTKRYAIRKSRLHLSNRRDLTFTGRMLRNVSLRTVSDNSARAALTSRKERIKGLANDRIEPWLVFSAKNRQAVMEAARQVFREVTNQLPK